MTTETAPLEMSPEQAKEAGFESMTIAYLPNERWMLDNALSDVTRHGKPAILVRVPEGLEIWTPIPGWTGNHN